MCSIRVRRGRMLTTDATTWISSGQAELRAVRQQPQLRDRAGGGLIDDGTGECHPSNSAVVQSIKLYSVFRDG